MLNIVGPVNSWTNQGPQQWDQTGSVDNQGGQFPHSTMPQDQYTQLDQNAQLQNGTVFYSKLNLLHNVVLTFIFQFQRGFQFGNLNSPCSFFLDLSCY